MLDIQRKSVIHGTMKIATNGAKHSIKSYNLAVYNMSYYGYGAVEREDYHILNSEYEVF